jgi:hypothetical protein
LNEVYHLDKESNNMKRLRVITALFIANMLAVMVVFEASAASPAETKSDNTPSHSVCVPALVSSADVRIAPVFDATGAVMSDPTGTMVNPNHPECAPGLVAGADARIAPVFDATGSVVSDPTGTLLNANHSEAVAVPVTGADVKIAPVFDATGAVVSDPTGTILSVINP